MTAPTEQTALQPQGTHHFVITLQRVVNGGFAMATFANHITPAQGATRNDVYRQILQDIASRNPELADANVVFFSLEPNQL